MNRNDSIGRQIKKSQSFPVAVVLLTAATLLWALSYYLGLWIPESLLAGSRWLAIVGLAAYSKERRSLTAWILFSMVVGAEIGHDWPAVGQNARTLSLIFLSLIKTIIAPLLFSTLVVGIAGHSNLRQVGRMGVKALVYFEVVTTIALFIGLAAINISKAGVGVKIPATALPSQTITAPPRQTASEIVLHIFPENIAKSVAEGQVLQIVVFSMLFGIALAMLPDKKRQPMLSFAESLSETMFKFTNIVMMFAPIGVGAAIAYTVGHMGLGVLGPSALMKNGRLGSFNDHRAKYELTCSESSTPSRRAHHFK